MRAAIDEFPPGLQIYARLRQSVASFRALPDRSRRGLRYERLRVDDFFARLRKA